VVRDVEEGFISALAARAQYGVEVVEHDGRFEGRRVGMEHGQVGRGLH
jgi:hypothetical protein